MTDPNRRKVERVARAICRAAGAEIAVSYCSICQHPEFPSPCMWESFMDEAIAAIKAMRGF